MEDWFKAALRDALTGLSHEGAGGVLAVVASVESFKGECTICRRAKKTSWIYEVSFKAKCKVGDEKCTLVISEMDNTDEEDYEIQVKWDKTSKNRQALDAVVKPKGQRGSDGLVPRVREAVAKVVEDYMQQ